MEDEIARKAEVPVALSSECVIELLKQHWGINAKRVKQLDSYDDRNYSCDDLYVFKVHNGVESRNHGLIEAQIAIMRRFGRCGIRTNNPIKCEDGREWALVDGHVARVISFVPGIVAPEASYQIGELVGDVSCALDGFNHPSLTRELMWDLSRVHNVRKFTPILNERQALVDRILERFQAEVLPISSRLPLSAIHGDMNEQNIVTSPDGLGVVDFGDAVYSWRVNEVAIAIAYFVIGKDKENIIESASAVLNGYLSKVQLTELELSVVPLLVQCRIACSITLGAYSASMNPENVYLLMTQEPGWKTLCILETMEPSDLINK